ncbi:alpha/beta hydrolase [Brevibacterium album]|uniref:alpha/beta hydrolase n=1 Tax=Brevibacterium album TaxID=417948 RepID=UPI0004029EA0|nr:alpha/beta fold hydrolase [Brevibacterium album]
MLVIHGAGGHSGALWPLAALLAERGLDIAAVDLPLYGRTAVPNPGEVRYDDWVQLLIDLVAAEHDGRPLILLGASIGGMLSYEVAAHSPHVAAVAATCLLDPRDWRARAHMTRFGVFGILSGPLAALARGQLATAMIPMRCATGTRRPNRCRRR